VRLGRLRSGNQQQLRQMVSNIDQNVDDVSRSTGRLSYSVYAVVGWVSLVTVAMAAVAVVTVLRRRRSVPVDASVADETQREWTRRSLVSVDEMTTRSSSPTQVISVSE